jgi:D-tyrosyl-tRNA(Tyr) deacylase
MKVVVQKVSSASVMINNSINGEIRTGLVVLVGFTESDTQETIKWICNKLINLRVFKDQDDKLNLSVSDIKGEILIISNFTLYGDVQRGFRPSFSCAANSEISEPLYNFMIEFLRKNYNLNIQTGIFGASMEVSLVNDGPVTIVIEKE